MAVVAGCASNQGLVHDRFNAVVLLSVPREVTFFSLTELGARMSLARVRDLRGAASAGDRRGSRHFGTDPLAGFMMARASAGLADSTILNRTDGRRSHLRSRRWREHQEPFRAHR